MELQSPKHRSVRTLGMATLAVATVLAGQLRPTFAETWHSTNDSNISYKHQWVTPFDDVTVKSDYHKIVKVSLTLIYNDGTRDTETDLSIDAGSTRIFAAPTAGKSVTRVDVDRVR